MLYKGFSFKNWETNKTFVLTDVDLVKQDLLNHIFTRRGERVGMRDFGTDIQDLLFEPYDDDTVTRIADQVKKVIDYDPRVLLISNEHFVVKRNYDTHTLGISAKLFFLELNLTDILDIHLEFEN